LEVVGCALAAADGQSVRPRYDCNTNSRS
jgi:hypothetical protein